MANAAKSGVPVFNYCGFPGELGLKGPDGASGYSHQLTDATLVSDSPLDTPQTLPNPFNRKHVNCIRAGSDALSLYSDPFNVANVFELENEAGKIEYDQTPTRFAYVNRLQSTNINNYMEIF